MHYIAIVFAVGLLACSALYARREAFTPVYCSSRSDNCLDLGAAQKSSTW